jgi:hypothetical protein
MDPVTDPGSTTQKPGYLSSEFYLSLLPTILGALMASGVFADDSVPAKIIGAVLAVLGALGYAAGRTMVKASGNKAAAHVAAAKAVADKLPFH